MRDPVATSLWGMGAEPELGPSSFTQQTQDAGLTAQQVYRSIIPSMAQVVGGYKPKFSPLAPVASPSFVSFPESRHGATATGPLTAIKPTPFFPEIRIHPQSPAAQMWRAVTEQLDPAEVAMRASHLRNRAVQRSLEEITSSDSVKNIRRVLGRITPAVPSEQEAREIAITLMKIAERGSFESYKKYIKDSGDREDKRNFEIARKVYEYSKKSEMLKDREVAQDVSRAATYLKMPESYWLNIVKSGNYEVP